jgi:hypothetical protein
MRKSRLCVKLYQSLLCAWQLISVIFLIYGYILMGVMREYIVSTYISFVANICLRFLPIEIYDKVQILYV